MNEEPKVIDEGENIEPALEGSIPEADAAQQAVLQQEPVDTQVQTPAQLPEEEIAGTVTEIKKPEAKPAVPEVTLSPEQAKALQQEKMIAIESIKKILDKARVAFLTTVSGKQLLSRPMYMQKREFDGTLWFFAKSDSPKVEDIRRDSRVNVLFTEKEFVSLSGRAEIVENDLKKKMYWGKMLEKYFETGYNDPNIVLIKIEALSAQLWEKPGSLDSLLNRVDPMSESDGVTVDF
ncbi:MAG: pyridoxamine 5'-phosphate oxidase family protein [Clostridiaceae bacterium]|nr:pyridoxamine 5'-phosphate oxidase family protein [Clostridiaceae bacterium]